MLLGNCDREKSAPKQLANSSQQALFKVTIEQLANSSQEALFKVKLPDN
jgi:hypothetical protein